MLSILDVEAEAIGLRAVIVQPAFIDQVGIDLRDLPDEQLPVNGGRQRLDRFHFFVLSSRSPMRRPAMTRRKRPRRIALHFQSCPPHAVTYARARAATGRRSRRWTARHAPPPRRAGEAWAL